MVSFVAHVTPLKAIPTTYHGVSFRSRTEARWAVFFDALGIRWSFEHEGFDLDGTWYLPDFYLPDLNIWWEVKGQEPTLEELAKAERLCRHAGEIVGIAHGQPEPDPLEERSHIKIFSPKYYPWGFGWWAEVGDLGLICPVVGGMKNEKWACWINEDWIEANGGVRTAHFTVYSESAKLLTAYDHVRGYSFWEPEKDGERS